MNQLNSLIIEGNLENGKREEKAFKFSVACNRFYKDKNGDGQNETSFFDVECWGKLADLCEKQFQKDRGVRIVGRLKQNRWKDECGKLHSKVIVIAEHVEFKPIIK